MQCHRKFSIDRARSVVTVNFSILPLTIAQLKMRSIFTLAKPDIRVTAEAATFHNYIVWIVFILWFFLNLIYALNMFIKCFKINYFRHFNINFHWNHFIDDCKWIYFSSLCLCVPYLVSKTWSATQWNVPIVFSYFMVGHLNFTSHIFASNVSGRQFGVNIHKKRQKY